MDRQPAADAAPSIFRMKGVLAIAGQECKFVSRRVRAAGGRVVAPAPRPGP